MAKKNENIAVAVTKPTEPVAEKAEARKLNGSPKRRIDEHDEVQTIGVAAEIAGIPTYVKNWRIPNAREHFPLEPLMRTVDKFFQYAKGGPLYVDEPTNPADVENCKRKAKIAAKEGIRYCYVTAEMTLSEARKQIVEPKEKRA